MSKKFNSILERFESHLVYLYPSTCIVTDYKKEQRGGHTEVSIGKRRVRAHRLAWNLYKGEIPKGLQVNHKCHNPKCVNTEHLYLGTQKDNIRDCIEAGRFPHLPTSKSKPLTEEERKIRQEGYRLKWRLKQKAVIQNRLKDQG